MSGSRILIKLVISSKLCLTKGTLRVYGSKLRNRPLNKQEARLIEINAL